MTDTNETLHVLARAQLALASSIAHVLEAVTGKTGAEVADPLASPSKPIEGPDGSSTQDPREGPPKQSKPKRKSSRTPNELDDRVRKLLESRPGTSVAELERELDLPDLPRSRLEWSLRRLLERGQIQKSGNTCGARYSAASSQPTGRASSLRVVES